MDTDIYNLWGLLMGASLLFISTVAAYRSYYYLRYSKLPLSRRIARLTLISSVFSMLGCVGVMVDSLTERKLWWTMAIFFPLAYFSLLSAIFFLLRLLRNQIYSTASKKSAPSVEPPEKGENPLPAGGFTISVSDLSRIAPLCRLATTTLYVGRDHTAKGCERFDGRIWVTRIDAPGSVDPAKLHVLQSEIMNFISGKRGALVIVDGIEHFLLYNDFRSVMKFLSTLKDYMVMNGSTLVVVIDEEALEKTQLSILRRELPPLNVEKALSKADVALFGVISKKEFTEGTDGEKAKREGKKNDQPKG
ncbi:hypothetical protein A3L12_01540 [Thermococcus sp. P6]|nr:hypothetical protein A3L12_01540 [Thermococcus sp. P6]